MGALRAIITTLISIYIVNIIYNNKNKLKKYPIFNPVLPYMNKGKAYAIIMIMIIIMIIW